MLQVLEGLRPVVAIHCMAEQLGMLADLLKEEEYTACPYVWINPKSADSGGARLCPFAQYLMLGTRDYDGASHQRKYLHFNAGGARPCDRGNVFVVPHHPNYLTKALGKAINVTEKPDLLLTHLLTLLGQPRGHVLDICCGSCSMIKSAFGTNRSIIACDTDKEQLLLSLVARASDADADRQEEGRIVYAEYYKGIFALAPYIHCCIFDIACCFVCILFVVGWGDHVADAAFLDA